METNKATGSRFYWQVDNVTRKKELAFWSVLPLWWCLSVCWTKTALNTLLSHLCDLWHLQISHTFLVTAFQSDAVWWRTEQEEHPWDWCLAFIICGEGPGDHAPGACLAGAMVSKSLQTVLKAEAGLRSLCCRWWQQYWHTLKTRMMDLAYCFCLCRKPRG